MTERRQFVGHTSSAEADQFTGLSRELTVDMQAETLRVHDGNTRGGFPLARADLANVSSSVLDARTATKENISNKTSNINSSSTDAQYPTARAVYNLVKNSHATGDIKTSLQTTNHGNWLLCNGQAVSRTDYPELFSLIGTTYGGGDGANTFNVPDYTNIKLVTSSNIKVYGDGRAMQFTSNKTDKLMIGGSGYNTGQGSMYVWSQNNKELPINGSTGGPSRALGLSTDPELSGVIGEATYDEIGFNYFIYAV